MAGIFENYFGIKPGPGISKKEPEKKSFFRFFDILKDKFWKISILNMIFFLSAVPLVLLSVLLFHIFTSVGIKHYLIYMLCWLPMVGLSPVIAGITKVTRDFVREVPGFLWADFKEAVKKNWKQAVIIGLFQYVLSFLLILGLVTYYATVLVNSNFLIPFGITILLSIVFLFMQYYLYMMMVTLKLSIKDIIKNAAIFSFLCFFKNLLLTIIYVLIFGIVGFFLFISLTSNVIFGIVLSVFMTVFFGISFFICSYFSFPPIKKYILDPYYEKHPEETSLGIAQADMEQNTEENKELPEFIYHNGKMVHRSAIEDDNVFED